ncbi:hypothetical protein E3N88_28445 [Mikania micrantha]|uniref:Expansin-like EG45 domain-containing protein n=1 Tax=Mikania micrantha TaxID=192012 RepID=A0A5N6N131_9ASTR|nr:hypothetical protein E3N88_28445 [Mikania micrantha]
MGSMTRAFILIAIIACLVAVANATNGQATFYTPPYVPSACFGNQNYGNMVLAANPALYATKVCGNKYRVTCTGGTNNGIPQPCTGKSVVVTAVDKCPGCASDQVDLSKEAFSVIANPDAGRIKISYTR